MDLIGQRLGNYQLVRLLGEGGYAQVYLGQHTILSMQAAIKVVQNRFTERDIARFLQEARAVASLSHKHIVRVLEGGVDAGRPYLVMEYAPGGSLRQRHADGVPLSLTMIERYVEQIAQALQYAHDQHLIHRDVKPENVLIGAQGHLLLTDFGLTLLTQSSSQLPLQEVVGTTAYMAPEQLQGHPRRASDQYALGVMVFEWLTGRLPFIGSVPELIAQHLSVLPSSPRALVPTISQPVEAVVLRALAKDPKARFPSVHAFADAFAEACQAPAGPPRSPRPLTARYLVTRPVPARQVGLLLAEPPHEGEPLHPVPAQALLATAEEAGPPSLSTAHTARLEQPGRTTRVTFRWHRFHLLPLHVGLALLVLVLATGGGLVWQVQATHFQQTVVTGKYVKEIRLGVGYDSDFGMVLGESDTFQVGTTVVLIGVVQNWSDVVDTQLFQGCQKIIREALPPIK